MNLIPNTFNKDYRRVYDFLLGLDLDKDRPMNYSAVRWVWGFTHVIFNSTYIDRFKAWEHDNRIVAFANYEDDLGDAFLSLSPDQYELWPELVEYAETHLSKEGKLKICVADGESELQRYLSIRGYTASQHHESDCVMYLEDRKLEYTLPEGFSVVSLEDDFDLKKYTEVLWHGFNHEGPTELDEASLKESERMLSGPYNDLSLKIAVLNPEGDFVSYAGMWYDPTVDFCTIEPAATHPEYRKMGLCKAAINEGVKRCKERGAKRCVVGSSQQFYYNIGFSPYINYTYYEKRLK